MTDSNAAPPIILQSSDTPDACVIWLHGLGADASDFAPIVKELDLPASMAIRFVFPNAPQRPISINKGYVMPGWYDITEADIAGDETGESEDSKGIEMSSQAMQSLVDQQREEGIEASRIIIAGFSQGGAVALHVGLHYPQKLAGVMALSTYLPWCARKQPKNAAGLPIFMAHGSMDGVVKPEYGRRSAEALKQLGCALEWREYPMAHSVCIEEIADISRWLQRILA